MPQTRKRQEFPAAGAGIVAQDVHREADQ